MFGIFALGEKRKKKATNLKKGMFKTLFLLTVRIKMAFYLFIYLPVKMKLFIAGSHVSNRVWNTLQDTFQASQMK